MNSIRWNRMGACNGKLAEIIVEMAEEKRDYCSDATKNMHEKALSASGQPLLSGERGRYVPRGVMQ